MMILQPCDCSFYRRCGSLISTFPVSEHIRQVTWQSQSAGLETLYQLKRLCQACTHRNCQHAQQCGLQQCSAWTAQSRYLSCSESALNKPAAMAYLHSAYTISHSEQNLVQVCQSIPDEFSIVVSEPLRQVMQPLSIYQVIENCHFLLVFSCKLKCASAPTR